MHRKLIFCFALSSILLYAQEDSDEGLVTFLEVPLSVNYVNVIVPKLMYATVNSASGGIGANYGIGIGARKDNTEFRFGAHQWTHQLNLNVKYDFTDSKSIPDAIIENGKLRYTGVYFRVSRYSKSIFFGGGLDLSITRKFKSDRIYIRDGKQSNSYNTDEGVLFDRQKQIIKLVLIVGARWEVARDLSIKPFFEIGLPCTPIHPKFQFQDTIGNNNEPFYISYEIKGKSALYYFPTFNCGVAFEI